MARVTTILVNLVPYHHARWEAWARVSNAECDVVELTSWDSFRVLEFTETSTSYRRHTLFDEKQLAKVSSSKVWEKLSKTLDELRPEVVCVSGWGFVVSLAAMQWASLRGVPLVMLSESNEFDEKRLPWKEVIKRRLVSLCAAGVAGGTPQADYLRKLGMHPENIFSGYDVVDNEYFERSSDEARNNERVLRASLQLPQRYFLACARFGRKKNILGLISSYSRFFERTSRDDVPHLIIVGDGEERVALEGLIKRNHLEKMVHLVGSKSYREMPAYYALAEVFIHASTTEQWGLVVNEAMASGLPVLVSNHCGCAADLVKEGENGFTFDPNDEQQIAGLMEKVSEDREGCGAMGVRSREIIANWSPSRFVEGLSAAVSVACFMKKHRASFLERLLLSAILLR